MLFIYKVFGTVNYAVNVVLLLITGFLVSRKTESESESERLPVYSNRERISSLFVERPEMPLNSLNHGIGRGRVIQKKSPQNRLQVNGPYALITTAVSAELGCHPSINERSNALATVTAIIDGTGSVGAALGPLFAAVLRTALPSWLAVFLMVMISNLLSLFCLLRITIKEIQKLRRRRDPTDGSE